MFFIIGTYPKEKILPYEYNHLKIHSCGKYVKIEIIKVSYVLALFFIPIFNFNVKYYARFTCCNKTYEIDKETGKKIERGENPPLEFDFEKNTEETIIDVNYTEEKICPFCEKELKEDFEYCPYCGKKL